jgi:transcriptional regulator with XRE-family HTH domain
MTISGTLRAARITAKLTQKKLGELIGYTGTLAQVQIAQWEAGTRPIPRDKLKAVAHILKIPLETLLP